MVRPLVLRVWATAIATALGILGLLWLPSGVNRITAPVDRTKINWVDLLWRGETLTVDLGELPEHVRGSFLVHDRSYTVRFQQDGCVWFSEGPSIGPVDQRTGDFAVDTVE